MPTWTSRRKRSGAPLTEPALLDRWLAEAKDKAEVVESQPGKSLRLTWRDRDADGWLVESEVTFTLTPMIGGGTRLPGSCTTASSTPRA